MKNFILRSLLVVQVLFLFTGCEPSTIEPSTGDSVSDVQNATTSTTFLEDFESGYKASYAAASVQFTNGSWYFDDALTGSLSGDHKNGSYAARVRNSGSIHMEFDLPDGAKSFTVSYAKYGKDKSTSFDLYYSQDGGSSWSKTGSSVSVSKTSLSTITFNLSLTGNVRFEIRKTDGTSNRFNLDDVSIEPNPVVAADFSEDFESGSKGSYAAGSVALTTGNWYLNDALIGSLTGDQKTGTQSVRIRNLGSLEMEFNVVGAQSVSVDHAVYGSDSSSDWNLEASTDDGSTWSQVGATVSSTSTGLQTISFAVNYTGNVRFRIVKISGGSNRVNIDNFIISGSSSSGGGSSGGGGTSDVGLEHLTMGNPSQAVTDVNSPDNYLLQKVQYVMSYNRDKGTANWVSWHLDGSWLGSAARQNDFREDASLPASWYHVTATDYQYSGFDRGHMCPSADRTSTVQDNSATFFMSNMVPQAPNNNRNTWANLESYCRTMLSGGNEIYIISGGYGQGGDGSNGPASTIANGFVVVPAHTWKVIMILPAGDNDVSRVTTNTRLIAVDLPNSQTISSDWKVYRTSVDDIELKTGYDFFNQVPDNIENVIESSVDTM